MEKILIITGPTAVGKSDFAEYIAHNTPAEIINADVGQLYEPLTIGTAKPDWRNSTIPHHLFDVCTTPENYSVAEYRAAVIKLVHEIQERGRLPIIVGGSGFYIKSLFFPPHSETSAARVSAAPSPARELIDSTMSLWDKLNAIDPVRAAAIMPNDHYRLERALEIWYNTGLLPSACAPQYNPIAPAKLVIVTRDRDDLYARINLRTEQMLGLAQQSSLPSISSWIQEVEGLIGTPWEQYVLEKKIIGYDDIVRYLRMRDEQGSGLENLTATIQQKTRNYAKRQLCFSRMITRSLVREPAWENPNSIATINMTHCDIEKGARCIMQAF